MLYSIFHLSDFKTRANTAFIYLMPGCCIFSLPPSEELLTRRAEYSHFFHVCAANGNTHWNKWQNAAIVVVAAVYLIILILSYKMDNH